MRLNKFLADRGVAARRKCDEMIADGRVSVNGRVVREPGSKVEERDKVAVDGRPVGGRERHVYYVLNKPVGVITTLDDPQGRRTIREFLPRGARVYPVGRLDADTSGLLLLTNDGELAHRLMHPSYGVPKVYRVRLAREPRPDQIRRLGSGVRFDRGQVSGPARVRRIDPGFDAIMIEVTIHEGRFRQVRKMCEAVGLEVTGLHRVGYGPLRLGPMTRGMFRELSAEEVAKLRAASARPGGKTPGADAPARPADPAAAGSRARPAEPRSGRRPPIDEVAEDAGDDREETWVAGGGALPRDDEVEGGWESESGDEAGAEPAASGWPARPSVRRGDRDWRAPGRGTEKGAARSDRGERDRRPGGRRAGERPPRSDEPGRRPRGQRTGERAPRSDRGERDRRLRGQRTGERAPRSDRGERDWRPAGQRTGERAPRSDRGERDRRQSGRRAGERTPRSDRGERDWRPAGRRVGERAPRAGASERYGVGRRSDVTARARPGRPAQRPSRAEGGERSGPRRGSNSTARARRGGPARRADRSGTASGPRARRGPARFQGRGARKPSRRKPR
jgi:23S rRNA pseudouridine2605 synthase